MRRLLAGAMLLAAAPCTHAAAAIQAAAPPQEPAEAAYDRGDDAAAFGIWSRQARQGDPQAELGLGLCYDLGRAVAPDPRQALDWYLRAGRAGLAIAEFNAAVMYDSGAAGPRDAGQAALWYARAAARGHARAQFDLAQLYDAGDGVPRNPAVAAAWYRAAAAGGVAAARSRRDPARPLDGDPAAPAAPAAEPVGVQVADGHASLELVWQAPAQGLPVTYVVEVAVLERDTPHIVFSAETDRSAVLATLPAESGRYAWRAYAVSEARQSYRGAPWTDFTISRGPLTPGR